MNSPEFACFYDSHAYLEFFKTCMTNISLTDIKMIEFKHKVSQALFDAETHQKCKRVTLLVSGTHSEINSSTPVFVRVLFCSVVFGIHLKSSLFSLFLVVG